MVRAVWHDCVYGMPFRKMLYLVVLCSMTQRIGEVEIEFFVLDSQLVRFPIAV